MHTTFCFYLIDFQLDTDFLSQFCIFLLQNHLVLLKDRFLKKMLLKWAKTHRLFVSPEGSSERDYMITDSVCSMYVVCT